MSTERATEARRIALAQTLRPILLQAEHDILGLHPRWTPLSYAPLFLADRLDAAGIGVAAPPPLDGTHDVRGHYPYHEDPHPDDHVHPTEPGLDVELIEQALNIIRAGTETAWLRRDYYLWKDQANDFLTALAARGTNDE